MTRMNLRKHRRGGKVRGIRNKRSLVQPTLQLEHLEPRWLLNGSSIVSWEPPAALNGNAATDSTLDINAELTTDSAGTWIAVWDSKDSLVGTIGEDFDILFSRSTDNGQTWSYPAPLNTNASSDLGYDHHPALATDSHGNWIAVWHSNDGLGSTLGDDSDILFSRSTDAGLTWSDPLPLNANAADDSGVDYNPELTTDSNDNWITVWRSTDTLGDTLGEDYDILFARSTDNGQTWSDPAPLNTNADTDTGNDSPADVTTDSVGNWIAVWSSSDSLGGIVGDDSDILFARSANNGQTWTDPVPLNTNAATDTGSDGSASLTTDSAGNWIAVWSSSDSLGGTIGEDSDILFCRSIDAGLTWSDPVPLNTNAATDAGDDRVPFLTTDSAGNWIAVWQSNDSLNGAIGEDWDVLFSYSIDEGQNWTDPAPLSDNDAHYDSAPRLTTDSTGNWIAVWWSTETLGGTIGEDEDILFSRGTIYDATSLFTDSFEYGQWNGLWVEDSQNDWFTSTQRSTDGSFSAEVDGSASNATITVAAPIDLTPYGSAELSFDWLIESGLDAGEYLALDFFDGSVWQEVARLSGNLDVENAWHSPVLTIDGEYLVDNFQFRFRAKMNGSTEDANVDNVQLIGIGVAGPPNQLPVAGDDAATTVEDNAVIINVLANDSDPDAGDVLQVAEVTQGAHGSVVDNGNGTVTYTPQANYFGSDSFTYTVADGRGGTDASNVAVTISAVNDAPVAVDDAASTAHDTAVVVAVLANDTDVDSSPLLIGSVTTPAHGTAVDNGDGTVTYTPAPGFIGADAFEYVVTDGLLSDTGTVTIDVQPDEVTMVYSNTTAKTIKDRAKTTSTLSVPDAMSIVDVNVQLNISHTRDQDLDVYLIAPDGTRVKLFTDVGGNGDHFTGTILDDQASVRITAGSAPFAGTYRPEGSLAALSGKNALGTWTLEITDDKWLYSGTLNSWSITVTGAPMALTAAAGSGGATGNMAPLTQLDAERAVDQALLWWSTYAHVQTSAPISVYVSNLPTGKLGYAWGQSLTLDVTADGAGWFLDRTSCRHSAFAGAEELVTQRMDLLTAVAHEVGHLLGYVHSDHDTDVMAESLPLGVRRLPGLGQMGWQTSLLDAVATPASPDSILDVEVRPRTRFSGADAALSEWNPLLAPIADTREWKSGIGEEVRSARVRVHALDESMALLADDLLDLLARAIG